MKKVLVTFALAFAIFVISRQASGAVQTGQTQPGKATVTYNIGGPEEWALDIARKPLNTLPVIDWEIVLSSRDASAANKDAADKVWAAIQGMQKNGQGKLRIPMVKVTTSTIDGFDAAVTEINKARNRAEIHVVMEKPMLHPPAPGSTTDIIGVITSYTGRLNISPAQAPDPFMFIMEKGELPGPKTPPYPQPAMDPDAQRHFEVNVDMGYFCLDQQDYQGAASNFRKALEYKPDDPEVTFKLAESLDRLHKLDEAQDAYRLYLQLLPNGPLAKQAKIALQRIKSASRN